MITSVRHRSTAVGGERQVLVCCVIMTMSWPQSRKLLSTSIGLGISLESKWSSGLSVRHAVRPGGPTRAGRWRSAAAPPSRVGRVFVKQFLQAVGRISSAACCGGCPPKSNGRTTLRRRDGGAVEPLKHKSDRLAPRSVRPRGQGAGSRRRAQSPGGACWGTSLSDKFNSVSFCRSRRPHNDPKRLIRRSGIAQVDAVLRPLDHSPVQWRVQVCRRRSSARVSFCTSALGFHKALPFTSKATAGPPRRDTQGTERSGRRQLQPGRAPRPACSAAAQR